MKNAIAVTMILVCASWMPGAMANDADAATPFLGMWKVTMDFQGRIVDSKLNITQKEDGALAGTWESRRGKSDLNEVKMVENQLHFSRTMNRQGTEMTIESTAKIIEDKLVGVMSTQMGDMEFSGVRPSAEDEESAGAAGAPNAASMLTRMDANGDGLIQESEAPEQMKQFFGMIDSNADGGIDAAELEVMIEYRRQQQGNN